MGGEDKSVLTKCGEILINIKLKSKKSKSYIFNCIFCDSNWDQLKKFSLHLQEEHLQKHSEEYEENLQIYEPIIKLEHVENEKVQILESILDSTKSLEVREDPLRPVECVTPAAICVDTLDVKVENESDENLKELRFNDEYDLYKDEIECAAGLDVPEDDIKATTLEIKKTIKSRHSKKKYKYSSDDSTDDSDKNKYSSDDSSDDSDYKEDVHNKPKKYLRIKKKSTLKSNDEDKGVGEICTESEKELILALFQAYEKQSYLWNVNEKKKTNNENTVEKGFQVIADEVNEKLNINITMDLARNRINKMRIEYSHELEKQRKGEEHQIPWYSEHMQFMQKNIDCLIRNRNGKTQLSRRATKMDKTHLPLLIEIYKKYEALWQVTNIAFRITAKRDEMFNKMIEDLKTNYDIEMSLDNLQDYIKYIDHSYSKDKEKQLKCELDNSKFIPTSQFYTEMSFLNESQGPFKCANCNEIILKYTSYQIHVACHNNTKPFKCPLCKRGFNKFAIYIMHAKRHLGINSFECNECGKGCRSKNELDWHLSSHTGDKPHLCQVCGHGFRARHDYDNHIRRHEKRFRYECHICKHGFNHLRYLNDHVKSHLDIRDNICNVCGKGFTAARYLRNHKLIHDDTKRYKCNVCGKEFSQTAGLRQHRKQHKPHLTAAEMRRKNESMLSSPDMFNF